MNENYGLQLFQVLLQIVRQAVTLIPTINHIGGAPAPGQASQSITDNDLTAEDAGTISCTVTIDEIDYTSELAVQLYIFPHQFQHKNSGLKEINALLVDIILLIDHNPTV